MSTVEPTPGQVTAAQAILLTAARYAMEAFIRALEERGERYVDLYAADDGRGIVAALGDSERLLVDAVIAEVRRGQELGLRGIEVAPRIRGAAREHGARVAAEYLISKGRVTQ